MRGDKLLALLKQKNYRGDVFSRKQAVKSISFENNQFKSIEASEEEGYGIRLLNSESREGFSYGNLERELIFEKAETLAEFGEKGEYDFPSKCHVGSLKLHYPEVLGFSEKDLIEKGKDFIERVRKKFPGLYVNVDFSFGEKEVSLLNTNGFRGSYEKTYFAFSISGMQAKDEIFEVYQYQVHPAGKIQYDEIIGRLEQELDWMQKKSSLGSGSYPVLFTPKALQSFMNILLNGFSGKLIEKGVSPIIERMGKKVGVSEFSVIDSGLEEGLSDTSPFDHEGTPSTTRPLIENGVIRDGIYDLKTAWKQGTVPTGNGLRSYASLPSPSFRNVLIQPGDRNLEEIISGVSKGLLVDQFLGAGMSNVMAGEFSANVDLGFLIENGEVGGRVKNTMISGNVFDMIGKIIGISSQQIPLGSSLFPYLLFDEVKVVG
jgi:PmbA protein